MRTLSVSARLWAILCFFFFLMERVAEKVPHEAVDPTFEGTAVSCPKKGFRKPFPAWIVAGKPTPISMYCARAGTFPIGCCVRMMGMGTLVQIDKDVRGGWPFFCHLICSFRSEFGSTRLLLLLFVANPEQSRNAHGGAIANHMVSNPMELPSCRFCTIICSLHWSI